MCSAGLTMNHGNIHSLFYSGVPVLGSHSLGVVHVWITFFKLTCEPCFLLSRRMEPEPPEPRYEYDRDYLIQLIMICHG